MGITGLWKEIGDGELISLAQLSKDYFERHRRPFRIAVDEAGWRFHNLTPQQVATIQAKEPAARPVEKAIFHRIVSLMQLNIQLMFVFDGAQRPWKRGRKGGNKIQWDEVKELRHLLTRLSIPHYFAPGEAEAECSQLQQEGIVDAVWTDDGDALMFGTTMLIRTHREKGGEKSKTHVNVYRAAQLNEQFGLDRDGFALFALLAGGDYETQGLPNCGPKTAMRLAREGVGQALRGLPKEGMHIWRQNLQLALRGKCEVPPDFPNMRALKYYMDPTVSSSEQLHSLRGLTNGWDMPLKEVELRSFLRTHYNIQIKAYLKHIIPILLLRTLCATTPGLERTNNIYGIELANVRKKKNDSEDDVSLIRKVTFLPQQVTSLDLSTQPCGSDGEDWTTLTSKNGTPFDATARIDCEMLRYALQKGVPDLLVDGPGEPGTKKSNTTKDDRALSTMHNPNRKRKSKPESETTQEVTKRTRKTKSVTNTDTALASIPAEQTSGKRKVRAAFRLPPQLDFATMPNDKSFCLREAKLGTDLTREKVPSVPVPQAQSEILDLERAIELSLLDQETAFASEPLRLTDKPSSADIRARRLAHFTNGPSSIARSGSGESMADAIVLD